MKRIKDRQKLSWQGLFYSIQRIDLLIISISGAGIYVCLETLKYLKESSCHSSNLIKVSGFVLLLAIITNFISQFLGRSSNLKDYLMCEYQLDAGKKPTKKEKEKIDELDSQSERYNNWTGYFNYISASLMFSGLILLLIYFAIIF